MAEEDGSVSGWVKRAARKAGRRYGEIRESYREGRDGSADGDGAGGAGPGAGAEVSDRFADRPEADLSSLPRNAAGEARIVCRRYAEKRAVPVDRQGRPGCFDPDHPDCQGCVEDVRDGVVETW